MSVAWYDVKKDRMLGSTDIYEKDLPLEPITDDLPGKDDFVTITPNGSTTSRVFRISNPSADSRYFYVNNTSADSSTWNLDFPYLPETTAGVTTGAIWDTSTTTFSGPIRTATYRMAKDTGSIAYGNHDDIIGTYIGDEKAVKRHQKQIDKANKKSFELLKEWLSETEYNSLMEEGNIELPSQYEKDTIYIVDKNPMKRIGVKKEGKVVQKSFCIHAPHSYADGDLLLANIMLLKTDEKEFLKIANVHDYTA